MKRTIKILLRVNYKSSKFNPVYAQKEVKLLDYMSFGTIVLIRMPQSSDVT